MYKLINKMIGQKSAISVAINQRAVEGGRTDTDRMTVETMVKLCELAKAKAFLEIINEYKNNFPSFTNIAYDFYREQVMKFKVEECTDVQQIIRDVCVKPPISGPFNPTDLTIEFNECEEIWDCVESLARRWFWEVYSDIVPGGDTILENAINDFKMKCELYQIPVSRDKGQRKANIKVSNSGQTKVSGVKTPGATMIFANSDKPATFTYNPITVTLKQEKWPLGEKEPVLYGFNIPDIIMDRKPNQWFAVISGKYKIGDEIVTYVGKHRMNGAHIFSTTASLEYLRKHTKIFQINDPSANGTTSYWEYSDVYSMSTPSFLDEDNLYVDTKFRDKLKSMSEQELEIFVRERLGQQSASLREHKKEHLRFDFDARTPKTKAHNYNVLEEFDDALFGHNVTLHSHKGGFSVLFNGEDGNVDCTGMGTVKIITKILEHTINKKPYQ